MNKRLRLVVNRWVAAMAVFLLWCVPMKAELKAGGEYYIWLNIYEKLLGTNEAGDGPALSAYGTKSDGYVFVAESSGENDYFLLKQKSSGKYLAASSSNNWSITLESKFTDNRFRWKMTGTDCYAYLTNKKNNSSYVGIDGANKGSKYVSIFYDKPKGSHGQFSVIPATGSSWDDACQAYESAVYTNDQKVKEIDYCQLNNKTIDRSDAVDIHITSNDNPIQGSSSVNLGSDRTWLIFDNIVPSKVASTYLKYVTINGEAAKKDVNCRVAIYLNGAAVIPIPSVIFSANNGGFTLEVGSHTNLGGNSNIMTSFTLRRGYMATLATGTNGSGYSRVYVADHADLNITLPEALDRRVSSVYVKKWQYLSKKGWGDTKGTTRGPELRATWYWCWNGDQWSTSNMEYVPCRQHRYWPSVSTVNEHASTATLSINEPEHSEQHTKSDCACSDNWTNCTLMPDYLPSGARIGSCQPTDFSWLKTFFGHVDDMAYRCDFAVTHAYWTIGSMDANGYANWFCNTKCKEVWNNVKRPLWLTELEISASWNKYNDKKELDQESYSYDVAMKYLQTLLQKIDECPWIERYAIYAFDHWKNYMFYDDGGITPAGQVYRDHRATFAYNQEYTKVPIWWKPGVNTPTLTYTVNFEERTITFSVGNTNGDATESIVIEHKPAGGSWTTLKTFDGSRSLLEKNSVTMTVSFDDINTGDDRFRVTNTTLYGTSATSSEVMGPELAGLEELTTLIATIEATYVSGFGVGEYAPYNNVAALKTLSEAKNIAPSDNDFQQKAKDACATLEKVVWHKNEVELDAVYDGTFANAVHDGAPAGWRMTNNTLGGAYHSRAFNPDTRLSEFNSTNSGLFLRFDGTNSNRGSMYYYGDTEGYTMPLKAGVKYRLTVDFANWGSATGKPLRLNLIGPTGFEAINQQYDTKNDADKSNAAPQQFVIDFTATVAGNYVFYFQCPGSDSNAHNVIVSNISLKRLVGDVDGDGKTNVEDVKKLLQHVLGNTPDGFVENAADMDGNGVVDISDITKLIEKLLLPN